MRLEPSNDRHWAFDKTVLARILISGDDVTIDGLRDFKWGNSAQVQPQWRTMEFRLHELTKLELVVEPFRDSELMAHTMLDFGLQDGRHFIVSVEARNEEGETYGLIPGALRQFELIYIFAAERDPLTLRAVERNTQVYIYPIKADQEFIRNLCVELANAANALHTRPRFYRTVFDNCTTTLVKHIDRQYPKKIGFRYETIFPAQTGRLLHDMGVMDTDQSYPDAQRAFKVDEKIRRYADAPDFSKLIRK